MKRKFTKAAGIILGYLIICGGILGWIEVSHETESRIDPAQTAMAQLTPESDGIRFTLLGNETIIDTSFAENNRLQIFILSAADPLLSGIYYAVREYIA